MIDRSLRWVWRTVAAIACLTSAQVPGSVVLCAWAWAGWWAWEAFSGPLGVDEFVSHGHCMLRRWDVILPWVIGDASTAFWYAAIPAGLMVAWWLMRKSVPVWAAASFASFILLCGIDHVLSIVVIWYPIYYLVAWEKFTLGVIVSPPAAIGLYVTIFRVARAQVAQAAAMKEMAAQFASMRPDA